VKFVFYLFSENESLADADANPTEELARLLEVAAKQVRDELRGNAIKDLNGHVIGRWARDDKHSGWRCSECLGESVQQLAWVNPNTDVKVSEFAQEGGTRDDFWCSRCANHTFQEQGEPDE